MVMVTGNSKDDPQSKAESSQLYPHACVMEQNGPDRCFHNNASAPMTSTLSTLTQSQSASLHWRMNLYTPHDFAVTSLNVRARAC